MSKELVILAIVIILIILGIASFFLLKEKFWYCDPSTKKCLQGPNTDPNKNYYNSESDCMSREPGCKGTPPSPPPSKLFWYCDPSTKKCVQGPNTDPNKNYYNSESDCMSREPGCKGTPPSPPPSPPPTPPPTPPPNPSGCLRYDQIFKLENPSSYSWPYDDQKSTYVCQNANYMITFFPSSSKLVSPNPPISTGLDQSGISLKFVNKGDVDIWLGIQGKTFSGEWLIPKEIDGYKLPAGTSTEFTQLPKNWNSVVIWPRTGCKPGKCPDGSGNDCISCDTGDCSSKQNNYGRNCPQPGNYCCWNNTGFDPTGGQITTIAEFTLGDSAGKDFYDTSTVNGMNIPIALTPYNNNSSPPTCPKCSGADPKYICTTLSADFDPSMNWCPEELKVQNRDGTYSCWSPCKIGSDTNQMARLYALNQSYKNQGVQNSLTKFVDWLDIKQQRFAGSPGSQGSKDCSTDKDCSSNEVCEYTQQQGQLPKLRCQPNPQCKSSSECTSAEPTNSYCGEGCYNYNYFPGDSLQNEFGRSKKLATLCCDCGVGPRIANFTNPNMNSKFCCDNGCMAGCSPANPDQTKCPQPSQNPQDTVSPKHSDQICHLIDGGGPPCVQF